MLKPSKQPKPIKRASVLAPRIKAGKADPISAEETVIVAELRESFENKYGSRAGKDRAKQNAKKHRAKEVAKKHRAKQIA